ncbi:hypothetical protein [Actinomadura viridis]|uniref:Uncharacterized protein n=1 Tax=Actinomadura viridis TaxID=58110 RepID=A0A931DND2_9ACTN|nr:hypothetical protein [Actinomadura viridis]MBG6089798.1 hypothetical protein [Actinomadura viridis]
MSRWVARRGWDVELIRLDGREVLRARQFGSLHAYCATVRELEVLLRRGGLTLADLIEVLPTARRTA